MGSIKGQMQSDSAQLQNFGQQLPEDEQARIQEMTDSYTRFEDIINRAAEDVGVLDTVDEVAQQARQSTDEALGQGQGFDEQAAGQVQEVQETVGLLGMLGDQVQETADEATDQVEGAADEATDQVQEAVDEATDQVEEAVDEASQMAESLPEGYHPVGEPTTDEEGGTVLRGEGPEGDIVTVRRAPDEEGRIVDSTFDPQGNLIQERVVPEPAPPGTTSTTRPSAEEESTEDTSWADSDSTVIEETKGSDGLLGGGLLRLDILAPPEKTTTTVESSDYEDVNEAASES